MKFYRQHPYSMPLFIREQNAHSESPCNCPPAALRKKQAPLNNRIAHRSREKWYTDQ